MKNKVLKVLMATMLMVSMVSTTCMAAGGGELEAPGASIIEGDSDVKSPIYKVVVPTTLEVAIDPFEQMEQSQIYSPDYYMINKSNVNVRVVTKFEVTGKDGVTFKTAEDDVKETGTDKLICMSVEVPGAVTETTEDAAFTTITKTKDGLYYASSTDGGATETGDTAVTDVTDVTGVYTTSVKKVIADTAATEMVYVLAAADYVEYYDDQDATEVAGKEYKANAGSQAGSTAFRFSGKVNSKANWAAEDIHVKLTYDFLGYSNSNYTDATTNLAVENAHAYIVETKAPVLAASATEIGVINYTDGTDDAKFIKLTEAKVMFSGTEYELAEYFAHDASAGTLTLDTAYVDVLAGGLTGEATTNEFTIKFQYGDVEAPKEGTAIIALKIK